MYCLKFYCIYVFPFKGFIQYKVTSTFGKIRKQKEEK